ncbi:MAG: hypothetical protein GX970_00235 [Phyllobacteriaceae bacterium]|nr:hypothetical protein [Phyllobacteriaceae bacterium]
MPINKPYANTRLTQFLTKRILELRSIKSQGDIASEAGFVNVNMLSIIKSGGTRLPIDRVPALAKALDTDPRRLLQLAVEQWVGATAARAFEEIFGTIVTLNEIGCRWRRAGQTFAVEFNHRKVDNISKAFRALVSECGLDAEVIPHALRHTGVTWAMQNDVPLWEASGYFGMSSKVLIEVYGHHHPDHLASAAASMGRKKRVAETD